MPLKTPSAIATAEPEGVFPERGKYSIEVFARRLGICEKTFRRKMKAHGILGKRFGRKIFIDAEECWAKMPDEEVAA